MGLATPPIRKEVDRYSAMVTHAPSIEYYILTYLHDLQRFDQGQAACSELAPSGGLF